MVKLAGRQMSMAHTTPAIIFALSLMFRISNVIICSDENADCVRTWKVLANGYWSDRLTWTYRVLEEPEASWNQDGMSCWTCFIWIYRISTVWLDSWWFEMEFVCLCCALKDGCWSFACNLKLKLARAPSRDLWQGFLVNFRRPPSNRAQKSRSLPTSRCLRLGPSWRGRCGKVSHNLDSIYIL